MDNPRNQRFFYFCLYQTGVDEILLNWVLPPGTASRIWGAMSDPIRENENSIVIENNQLAELTQQDGQGSSNEHLLETYARG